jgi:hypothetical protein
LTIHDKLFEIRSKSSEIKEHKLLGIWGTVFAIMSTVIGGGIVGIPWAFYHCGFYLAIAISILASI